MFLGCVKGRGATAAFQLEGLEPRVLLSGEGLLTFADESLGDASATGSQVIEEKGKSDRSHVVL